MIIDAVRDFFATNLRIADAHNIDSETPLIQRGIIDSIELMQIVTFLEQRFAITIDETEVLPGNLRTLAAMERFVLRKQGAAAGSSDS